MNTVPRVDTAEISDAALDQVSGGLAISTALIAGDGALGAGLYAEAGAFSLTTGLGASAPFGGAAAHAHTTSV
ncbi:hypothetical protein [Streptomyces sp. MH60]|uniref:hypothetical protein n=1 Tax=Streptomyces sp. MH60 TaxID=1940758 RepID=UPI000CEE2B07|nr:hypothetical protein [Streptomyces sp. MH60]PPS90244.1 hypothetical protein BZZ08_00946 [Streptomyces sp. MH60]